MAIHAIALNDKQLHDLNFALGTAESSYLTMQLPVLVNLTRNLRIAINDQVEVPASVHVDEYRQPIRGINYEDFSSDD